MKFRPKQSTIIIFLTTFAVVGFVLWSVWAEIDQITRAKGEIIPSGRTQVIQSLDGGTISEILVQQGDRVEEGQVLVRLDEVRPRAAVEESLAQVAALRSKMVRIQAELFDRPLAFPADLKSHPEFLANQRELFHRRRSALSSQITSLQSMLRLVREELNMNLPLVESGDVSRSEVIRMQRTVADLEGQITSKRSEYLAELQTEYTTTEEELATAEQQLKQRQAVLDGTVLRAPTDGVVVNVRLTTVGGVVKPGDEVLQMVPTGDELIVEARVEPSEIAYVKVGQYASVKFDAYDSSIYGSADGRVTYVSADTLSEETEDGVVTYYRVQLAVETSGLRPRYPDERITLQPGMTVVAEIVTGRSTVFDYLTKPIRKVASESMGER